MHALLLALLLAAPAEAGRKKRVQEPPVPLPPVVQAAHHADAPEVAGSLWDEVRARRLLGLDGNARQVGDLVTVHIIEHTATALDANTKTTRNNTTGAGITAMLGAENTLAEAFPRMGSSLNIEGSSKGTYDGQGSTNRASAVDTTLTCQVIEVLDNGNLHIWGWKKVRVNREIQYVVLEGVARPRDIQLDNTVSSELLALASIEVVGSGVLADRQGPGWLTRVLDVLWPF